MDGTNISQSGAHQNLNHTQNRIAQSDHSTPVWDTQVLFQGTREVRLCHAGVEYRLRITRNDRLILIK